MQQELIAKPLAIDLCCGLGGSSQALVVRAYGLRAPIDWGEDCEDQLRRMTGLWNQLVEIEQAHRSGRQALIDADQDVATALAAFEAVRSRRNAMIEERKARRKAARSKIATPDLDLALAALKPDYAGALDALKESRRQARAGLQPRLAALEAERKAKIKTARQAAATAGLWWGNYNAVLADFQTARQVAIKTGAELRFHAHDGSGRIVNQVIGGVSAESLFGAGHAQIRIAPATAAWRSKRAASDPRCAALIATVYARGRAMRRNVTWPMILHRPFPPGAVVQQMTISRRRCADRWAWQAVFTCRVPSTEISTRPAGGVGIDIGWRLMPDGLRVATAADDDGNTFFAILPLDHLRKYEHLAAMANDRDTLLNRALADLRALDWQDAPDRLREAAHGVRSASRVGPRALVRLIRRWRTEYGGWRADALAQLDDWRLEDRYIWRLHAGLGRRLARRRRDLYRNFAADIARRFGLIAIEQLDMRALKAQGDEPVMQGKVRNYAQIAAGGDLLACIRHAAIRDGRALYEHGGASTWACHKCGHVNAPADRAALMHRCKCGALWDQDVNAALNLLAAGRASGAVPRDRPGSLESRWTRAKQPKSEDRPDL